ncbi:MAG: hypothetical protein J7599_01710 [Niabella sp.]|nr:hypothetical protein [Niabella sp.]
MKDKIIKWHLHGWSTDKEVICEDPWEKSVEISGRPADRESNNCTPLMHR